MCNIVIAITHDGNDISRARCNFAINFPFNIHAVPGMHSNGKWTKKQNTENNQRSIETQNAHTHTVGRQLAQPFSQPLCAHKYIMGCNIMRCVHTNYATIYSNPLLWNNILRVRSSDANTTVVRFVCTKAECNYEIMKLVQVLYAIFQTKMQ